MSQRSYTDEYKRDAVRLATSGEKSVAQTARDLNMSADTLYTWVRLFGPAKEGEPEPLSPDERTELLRLRRENKRLQEERDILKKAVGLITKEQR